MTLRPRGYAYDKTKREKETENKNAKDTGQQGQTDIKGKTNKSETTRQK